MKRQNAHPRTVAIALGLDKSLPWHHGIYAGTQQYALEQPNWRCVIDEFPQNILRQESGRRPRYDGIIARVTRPLSLCAKQRGIPLVNVWQNSPVKNVPSVSTNHERGGRQIAEHLLDRGLQRFGYISAEGRIAESIECQHFCKRIEEAGYSSSRLTVVSAPNLTADYWSVLNRSIDQWLSERTPPIGVAVAFPNAARILVHLCENRGLRVPLDVAIICTAASRAICESPPPALTSFDYNWELLGYEAAKTLDAMMAGGPAPTRQILVPPKGVTPRASTDFMATESSVVRAAYEYITTHLSRPLSIDEVASAIDTSPRTLRRRFEENLGRSLSEEIRRLRIELAKRMLAEPKQPISDISSAAGFTSPNRMCEVFRRDVGMTPSAYRKQILGENQGD